MLCCRVTSGRADEEDDEEWGEDGGGDGLDGKPTDAAVDAGEGGDGVSVLGPDGVGRYI